MHMTCKSGSQQEADSSNALKSPLVFFSLTALSWYKQNCSCVILCAQIHFCYYFTLTSISMNSIDTEHSKKKKRFQGPCDGFRAWKFKPELLLLHAVFIETFLHVCLVHNTVVAGKHKQNHQKSQQQTSWVSVSWCSCMSNASCVSEEAHIVLHPLLLVDV